jgi:hypothetical protein
VLALFVSLRRVKEIFGHSIYHVNTINYHRIQHPDTSTTTHNHNNSLEARASTEQTQDITHFCHRIVDIHQTRIKNERNKTTPQKQILLTSSRTHIHTTSFTTRRRTGRTWLRLVVHKLAITLEWHTPHAHSAAHTHTQNTHKAHSALTTHKLSHRKNQNTKRHNTHSLKTDGTPQGAAYGRVAPSHRTQKRRICGVFVNKISI